MNNWPFLSFYICQENKEKIRVTSLLKNSVVNQFDNASNCLLFSLEGFHKALFYLEQLFYRQQPSPFLHSIEI